MEDQELTLRIGNTAEATGNARHPYVWEIFVEPHGAAASRVSGVTVQLHPTFEPRSRRLTHKPAADCTWGSWRSGRVQGWGTFTVGLSVELDGDATSIQLQHSLSFNVAESATTHSFQLPPAVQPMPEGQADEDTSVPPADDASNSRWRWQQQLAAADFLRPESPCFMHGRAFSSTASQLPPAPRVTWRSREKPRDDHEDAASWLTASEFEDTKPALEVKCRKLAELLRLSRKTVVYSGAGLSVAAGIGQAARGAAKGGKSTDATPTYAHYALGAMYRAGLLHGWVQQNHDGLPQKAGVGQEAINEIHGSWYDPSNPVVKYSGTLKSDCYPNMRQDADSADLVLVIGTTLGGLNADQVATKPAARSRRDLPWDGTRNGGALGTVIINLQQTEQDGKATLRLFGKADNVLRHLLPELGIESERLDHLSRMPWLKPPRMPISVPYDSDGHRLSPKVHQSGGGTFLDLRVGAKVRLADDHNVQGARQPAYMHIGAEPGTRAKNGRPAGPGLGVVKAFCPIRSAYVLEIEGVQMLLGVWWAHAAASGAVEQLPVLNVDARVARAG